jgi:hypothetical protein
VNEEFEKIYESNRLRELNLQPIETDLSRAFEILNNDIRLLASTLNEYLSSHKSPMFEERLIESTTGQQLLKDIQNLYGRVCADILSVSRAIHSSNNMTADQKEEYDSNLVDYASTLKYIESLVKSIHKRPSIDADEKVLIAEGYSRLTASMSELSRAIADYNSNHTVRIITMNEAIEIAIREFSREY